MRRPRREAERWQRDVRDNASRASSLPVLWLRSYLVPPSRFGETYAYERIPVILTHRHAVLLTFDKYYGNPSSIVLSSIDLDLVGPDWCLNFQCAWSFEVRD